ncbi:DUF3376 domain-containing protein [Agromyces sp. G08B096]|uniref:DUF3376 domain-containing protein n=1 Tax=Agromyces sp. G08B096 TaxID=3156399 RepID=A0AAU7W9U1_9MICO
MTLPADAADAAATADPGPDRRPPTVVSVPVGATLAASLPLGARPATGRTLRVALAMRGGVSLAVWIGGVAAELDLLRRIRLFEVGDETWALVPASRGAELTPAVERRVREYADLLDRAGYDRVEIDLLAGASAGGLNAVVYSVAQRAGVALDGLLRTWGRVGGFWGLLHEPGAWRPLALMRGEDYFRRNVREALEELHGSGAGHPDLVADYVSVDLSTTMIDAADQAEEDASEGRGHFRFVGSDTHHLDNLVPRRDALAYPGKAEDDAAQLDQLALAARSTSSLAGGFEPALIRSTEWPGPEDSDVPGDPLAAAGTPASATAVTATSVAERADLRFAFAAHRTRPAEPFRVIDGAVFDNVPIDRALRAAKLRPSDRLADRILVFLDPEPDPALGGPAPWDPDASRFFRAVGAMFAKSFRRESVAREASDLQRFNGQRAMEAGRRLAGASLVATAGAGAEDVARRRAAYVRSMGGDLGEHLADVLAQPSLWQLRSPSRRRRRYTPVDRTLLAGLDEAATARFAVIAGDRAGAALRSPLALADAANCVLAWTRELEQVPEVPGGRRGVALTDVRRDAYAALADASGSVDALTERVLLHVLRTLPAGRPPGPADFDAWIGVWLEASDAVDAEANWRALDRCLDVLCARTAEIDASIDAHDASVADRWRRSPWRALARSAAVPARAIDLAPLAYPLGVPASLSRVDYWTIGVDEPPAAPEEYTELLRDRFLTRLQTTLRTPRLDVDDAIAQLNAPDPAPLDRQTKLAGYGFGNFLGFLAKDWRVNDWWWGRLDGSAGIVRLLSARAGEAGAADADPAALAARIDRVQASVLEESDDAAYRRERLSPLTVDERATDAPPADAPVATSVAAAAAARRARLRAGTDTLWNLRPGYRFALASRAIRLVDRAAMPANRILAVALQTVFAVLRPLVVAVPAVADPPRLALVAGLTAGAAWLLTWSAFAPTTGSIVAAIVVASAGAVGLIAGVVRARTRWTRVERGLADGDRRSASAASRRASRWPAAKYAAVAAASLIPLAIAVARANLVMIVLCALVVAALVSVAVRAASGARPTTVAPRLVRTNLSVAVFVVLGGLLPLAQILWVEAPGSPSWLRSALAPPLEQDLAVLAVGGLLVAVALTADWLPVTFTRAARASSRWVDWFTVSVISTGAAWIAGALVVEVMALAGRPEQHGVGLAIVVFLIVWANGVWLLPEFRRAEFDVPDRDLVDRRPARR